MRSTIACVVLAGLVLVAPGCGAGLSQQSSSDLGSTLVNGALLGTAALVSAGRAPTDRQPTYSSADPDPGPPLREFVCRIESEDEIVEARSVADACRQCGGPEECDCRDPRLVEEAHYWSR